MDWNKLYSYLELAVDKTVYFLPRIALAGLVLWGGFKLADKLVALFSSVLEKAGFSKTLRPFMESLASILLKGLILFMIASILGADLTGLVAILAAAGFAVGLALQGSLGNFASGMLILTLKPYHVGEWIQVEDKFGKVQSIGIFSTDVLTPGNKVLIIPNSKITDSVVTNYSEKGYIRLELSVTMPYNESFPKVKEILEGVIADIDLVLDDPLPEIGIHTFDSHNITLLVRPYVHPDSYWEATFEVNQAIKNAFHQHNIQMAYSEGVAFGSIGA